MEGAEDINMQEPRNGYTALHIAMMKHNPSLVRLLLSRPETRLDLPRIDGNLPLHAAAETFVDNSEGAISSVIRIFCQDRRFTPELFNVRTTCERREIPLESAIRLRNLEAVKELVLTESYNINLEMVTAFTVLATQYNIRDAFVSYIEQKARQTDELMHEDEEERPAQRPRTDNNTGQKQASPSDLTEVRTRAALDADQELDQAINEASGTLGTLRTMNRGAKELRSELTLMEERFQNQKETKEKEIEWKRKELDDIIRASRIEIATMEDNFKKESEQSEQAISSKRKDLNDKLHAVDEQKKKLQQSFGPPQPPLHLIPDCPVCFETMSPPAQIHNCQNGHLICGTCRPRVETCATCRSGGYIGRAIAVEQIVRRAMNVE